MTSEQDKPDWLAELARGGQSMRRQVSPIVRAAQQFVDDARAAQAQAGTPLPFAQQITLTVDAGIREVISAVQGEGGLVLGNIGMNITATVVADIDVIRVTEHASVVVLEESGKLPSGDQAAKAGQLLVLVLVWILALGGPIAQQALAPEAQAVLTNELATFGLALMITWRILDKRDR